jgi:hypothetical protein
LYWTFDAEDCDDEGFGCYLNVIEMSWGCELLNLGLDLDRRCSLIRVRRNAKKTSGWWIMPECDLEAKMGSGQQFGMKNHCCSREVVVDRPVNVMSRNPDSDVRATKPNWRIIFV